MMNGHPFLLAWGVGYLLFLGASARLTPRDAAPWVYALVVFFMALWPLWLTGLIGLWIIGVVTSRKGAK